MEKETTGTAEGWRAVMVRLTLIEEIDRLIKTYKQFGVSKWNSRSHFVQEAVIQKLKDEGVHVSK